MINLTNLFNSLMSEILFCHKNRSKSNLKKNYLKFQQTRKAKNLDEEDEDEEYDPKSELQKKVYCIYRSNLFLCKR